MALFLAGFIACMGAPDALAAEGSYITDVTVRSGDDATSELESDGYTVVYPAVGKDTWIGYKTAPFASDAITDICLGGDGTREIDGTSVSYEKADGSVSGRSLYYTKSPKAGSPLLGLYFVTGGEGKSIPALMNDGSGTIAELKNGTDQGYLIEIKQDLWKRLIRDVEVVKAGSRDEAIRKLGENGCDYYIDKNMSAGDCTMIGFSRTNDESEAVTDAILLPEADKSIVGYEQVSGEKVLGGYLYISRDEAVGNPLIDLDVIEGVGEETISEAELAEYMSASGNTTVTLPYIRSDKTYLAMREKDTPCLIAPIAAEGVKDKGLVSITSEDGLSAKREVRADRVGEMAASGEDDKESESEEDASEELELPNIIATDEKEEVEESYEEEGEYEGSNEEEVADATLVENEIKDISGEEDAGTTINTGVFGFSTLVTILLIILIVLIPVGAFIAKKLIDRDQKDRRKSH